MKASFTRCVLCKRMLMVPPMQLDTVIGQLIIPAHKPQYKCADCAKRQQKKVM